MHNPLRQHFAIHRVVKIRNELEEIYLNQVIRTFAVSLIGIFIPIYLLNIGFALNEALFYLMVVMATLGTTSPLDIQRWSAVASCHLFSCRARVQICFSEGSSSTVSRLKCSPEILV